MTTPAVSFTGAVVLTLSFQGNGLVEQISQTITNTSSPAAQFQYTLNTGFNSLSVPAGAVAFLLIPPTTNTEAMALKGYTGDTGTPISPTAPTLLSLASTATTVGITAAGSVTLLGIWL